MRRNFAFTFLREIFRPVGQILVFIVVTGLVLSGFMLDDKASTEAGFKYLLYGALTSAIMLYGFSLLFGFSGTTDLYKLAGMVGGGSNNLLMVLGVIFLILVGLGLVVHFMMHLLGFTLKRKKTS